MFDTDALVKENKIPANSCEYFNEYIVCLGDRNTPNPKYLSKNVRNRIVTFFC